MTKQELVEMFYKVQSEQDDLRAENVDVNFIVHDGLSDATLLFSSAGTCENQINMLLQHALAIYIKTVQPMTGMSIKEFAAEITNMLMKYYNSDAWTIGNNE